MKSLRQSTLETLGLGYTLGIFQKGRMPVSAGDLVDQIFGKAGNRAAMVISGANGIVGAGKTMQLGARLFPFDIPVVALDFPGAPDGIGGQYPGLKAFFGPKHADEIMASIIRLNYDGKHLPPELKRLRPHFLLRWYRHDQVRKLAPLAPIASCARNGFGPISFLTYLSIFQKGILEAR